MDTGWKAEARFPKFVKIAQGNLDNTRPCIPVVCYHILMEEDIGYQKRDSFVKRWNLLQEKPEKKSYLNSKQKLSYSCRFFEFRNFFCMWAANRGYDDN